MEKPEKKKKFKNEELCFNPFSDLVGKVAHVDGTIADKGNSLLSLSEDTGSIDRDTIEPLSAKSVVSMRLERKGRGGKTVTLVMVSPTPDIDRLKILLRSLKRFLGCGASMEGEVLVIQGDQRERIAEWFTSKGIFNIRT